MYSGHTSHQIDNSLLINWMHHQKFILFSIHLTSNEEDNSIHTIILEKLIVNFTYF